MNRYSRTQARRSWLAGAPALLLLGGAACASGTEGAAAADSAAAVTAVTAVLNAQDVAVAKRARISPAVVLTGSLDPYKVVEVKAQVPGTIARLNADRGQSVRRGQVLAVIEAQGIRSQAAGAQAQVAAAESQLALAQRQLESTRQLYEAGASSEIDFRTAQTQYQAGLGQLAAARAQAAGASESAARATVAAPLTGRVSARAVSQGEAVNAGQQLFTVVDSDTLELSGQISVQAAAEVKVGQQVTFTLDAYPGRRFTGRVARIDPTADPATRRVGTSVYLPNRGGEIVGGQFVTGQIVSGAPAEDAVVVPQAAVRGSGDSAFVLVIDQGKIARRRVTLGSRDDARHVVAVAEGVREGEQVIVSPSTEIVEGTPVRVAGATRGASGAAAADAPATATVPAAPERQ